MGIFEVQACQPQKSPEEVDEPDEQPRVPCATDAECRILDGRAVCAEYQGVRDCTLPCTIESDCDPPSLGGMSLDFLRCAADEGAPARSACLPDPRCFTDPFACVSSGQCSGPGAFLCATGECIDASDVCDGLADCGSGDDEVACTQPACGVGEVPCASGECIAAAFVCDLFEDCADGSDESSCN